MNHSVWLLSDVVMVNDIGVKTVNRGGLLCGHGIFLIYSVSPLINPPAILL